ncbi:MAG: Hsp20/alpha crystallin family protein [Acidobacteriota bacterium]|nr:Hsp20/alpha crystallin family protein [Acidobacteriota bacterium]
MTLTRWDPFYDLFSFQDKVNRLFSNAQTSGLAEASTGAWTPTVDIYEEGDTLVLQAELPGVNKDDVEVQVEGNILTLRGERRQEKDIKEDQYHRLERVYGSFMRSFTLPVGINRDKIRAEYRDGVLKLALPRAEEAKPKKIKVLAA